MRNPLLSTIGVLVLGASATHPSAQGRVWVIDDDGGRGVDFIDLQPAIDTAADGDTLLVRAGSYRAISVDAKALTIVGDPDADVFVGPGAFSELQPLLVRNLGADQTLALRGLRFFSCCSLVSLCHGNAGNVLNNAGSVWIEDCSFQTRAPSVCESESGPIDAAFFFPLRVGLFVRQSAEVHLTRCSFLGGKSGDPDSRTDGPGVEVHESFVTLQDCVVEGGGTGGCLFNEHFDGGDGLLVGSSALVFASNTSFRGGDGGLEPCDGETNNSRGGDGIRVLDDTSVVSLLAATLTPGGGGQPGQEVGGESAAVEYLPGPARGLVVDAPVEADDTVALVVRGEPGETAWLLSSLETEAVFLPQLRGVRLLGTPVDYTLLGIVPASGTLSIDLPPLPPSVGDSLRLFLQPLFVSDPGNPTLRRIWRLGGGSVLITVADGLLAPGPVKRR